MSKKYGPWLNILPCDRNLGCIANVNHLLEKTSAPYVAISDQDDLWDPHKLEISLHCLRALEQVHSLHTPFLVHSDLALIDEFAVSLNETYIHHQRLNPKRTNLLDLAFTNVVTGCTVMINRSLLNKAMPIPPEAFMHNWWLALVASSFGHIEFLLQPLVLYRQHEHNSLGAQGFGVKYFYNQLLNILNKSIGTGYIFLIARQMKKLHDRYDLPYMRLFDILELPRFRRWYSLMRLPKRELPSKHGLIRTVGLYFHLLLSQHHYSDHK